MQWHSYNLCGRGRRGQADRQEVRPACRAARELGHVLRNAKHSKPIGHRWANLENRIPWQFPMGWAMELSDYLQDDDDDDVVDHLTVEHLPRILGIL